MVRMCVGGGGWQWQWQGYRWHCNLCNSMSPIYPLTYFVTFIYRISYFLDKYRQERYQSYNRTKIRTENTDAEERSVTLVTMLPRVPSTYRLYHNIPLSRRERARDDSACRRRPPTPEDSWPKLPSHGDDVNNISSMDQLLGRSFEQWKLRSTLDFTHVSSASFGT